MPAKFWAALNLSGLSTAKTIDRWLLPHQATSSVDHVAELRRVIRRLVQATDKMSAALAWSTEAVRFSRLSESGIIPPFWVQEIQKAMAADDWLQADTGDPALPATAAGEQTPQSAQSCGGVRQWRCHGNWIYLDDS